MEKETLTALKFGQNAANLLKARIQPLPNQSAGPPNLVNYLKSRGDAKMSEANNIVMRTGGIAALPSLPVMPMTQPQIVGNEINPAQTALPSLPQTIPTQTGMPAAAPIGQPETTDQLFDKLQREQKSRFKFL